MRIVQIVNVASFIAVLIVNWLANSLPLNGQNTGAISAKVPTLFTPAAYVFSIWGLIYLLLMAFAIYQGFPGHRDAVFLKQIGYWFLVSCVCNIAWLFLWHYEHFYATMLAMLGLLVALIMIYQRLGIGHAAIVSAEKWWVHIPFSIYLGWISVAAIANFSIIVSLRFPQGVWGLSPVMYTMLLILLAGAFGVAMVALRHDMAYALVIVWALIGIMIKQFRTTPVIAITAGIMAVVLLAVLTIFLVKPSVFSRSARPV